MTPMFPQRCTTDKKDLLCADDQQIFTSQVTFQSSSCKSSEPTRSGFSSGFSSQKSWVNEVRGIKSMFNIRLKLLCTFVIIIDVVKTIHRWGFEISILKYIWDVKCFKWKMIIMSKGSIIACEHPQLLRWFLVNLPEQIEGLALASWENMITQWNWNVL